MTNVLSHIKCYKGPWEKVVDIGAYHGDFVKAAIERGAFAIAFEAHPVNYGEMVHNLSEYDGQYTAFDCAVVGTGKGPWYLAGDGPLAMVRPNIPGHPIPTISFTGILERYSPIDFLKIDIEGGEHEMLSKHHELEPLWAGVRFIQLEIHPPDSFISTDPENEKGIKELIKYLRSCGFKDKACKQRKQHPGDFCSHNENFRF